MSPATAASTARHSSVARAERAGRLAVGAATAGALAAIGLLAASAARSDGIAVVAGPFEVDRLGAVLLLLVLGVSAVCQQFARGYLRGDVRAPRLFALASALTAATALLVTATSLVALAAAWSAAGIALVGLLGLYRGHASADEGVRRTRIAFVIGDGALWLAVAISLATWGNLDLRTIDAATLTAGGDTTLTIVALLLVIAAAARSAQLGMPRWLPATLAAPTPVSALLHAGVVNGGGILLVRTSPIFGASGAATALAFGIGAATMVGAGAMMLAKPDVKGALAHSTMAQMGFMLMTCGLGAWVATIVHLVAHGMYKATLFLGSGSAVQARARARLAPPAGAGATAARHGRLTIAALAIGLPAAALGLAVLAIGPDLSGAEGGGALLIFAWASSALALAGWLRRGIELGRIGTAVAALVPASAAHVGLISGAGVFLAPTIERAAESTAVVPLAWLALPLVALAILAAAIRGLLPAAATRRIYVLALAGGDAARRISAPALILPGRSTSPAPVLLSRTTRSHA